jgi:UPF0755 protein
VKRFLLLGCFVLLLAAAAVGGAGWWGWQKIHQPYRGFAEDEVVVVIESGMGASAILAKLEEAGVIFDRHLARLYLQLYLGNPPLQAGEYVFREAHTVPEVLEKLIQGEVKTYPATIIEGLTVEETAKALTDQGFGDREYFLEAMRSPALIADLDPEATDLEGYLFPETYHFARGTSEEEIVETMVRTFRKAWRDEIAPRVTERVQAKLEEQSRKVLEDPEKTDSAEALEKIRPPSVRELVTLASVVEKEARLDEERPIIAGVYQNRLDRGMALQADPTVIFALKRRGTWDGNIRRPDLELDSPYNTYVYPGLPPGPIASPGLASLKAAAAPADVPYYYFVSRNDGSHVFSTTLREHNQNVERWQKRYWRERWAAERRGAGKEGGSGGRR